MGPAAHAPRSRASDVGLGRSACAAGSLFGMRAAWSILGLTLLACGGASALVGDPDASPPDGGAPDGAAADARLEVPDASDSSEAGAGAGASPDADAGAVDAGGDASGRVGALPRPTGACPQLVEGMITVAPAGVAPRRAQVWISTAAATLDGPVVFYWHGTTNAPAQAEYALGRAQIDAILAQGGVVIAPEHDPAAGILPWFLADGVRDDDLRVADELLACAAMRVGVDARRIHSVGLSAGGFHTSVMSLRRASYLASVVSYSGGLTATMAPTSDAPGARFAALVLHGGADDKVFPYVLQTTSERYVDFIKVRGHFPVLCDHGQGHDIPAAVRASAWRFLQDHPYGATPSPYATGLPAGFHPSCALVP